MRQATAINASVLKKISLGWLLTPILSLILAAAGYAIFG
jgi:phosphate/sulfate permease